MGIFIWPLLAALGVIGRFRLAAFGRSSSERVKLPGLSRNRPQESMRLMKLLKNKLTKNYTLCCLKICLTNKTLQCTSIIRQR